MKTFLLTAFLIFNLVLFGQENIKKIKNINTVEQAENFINENPSLNLDLLEFNSKIDSSEIANKIYNSNLKSVNIIEDYIYETLEIKSSVLFRVSYIYLDGDKLSLGEINSLRKVIIDKYNNGVSFKDLAKEYNMDGNPDCDLGWFSEEMMVEEFSSEVKKFNNGDIFSIDVPSEKWHYVVLKTHENMQTTIYNVLKIKSTK